MRKKYCDDVNCPHFEGDDCRLGFKITFHVPKSYTDIQHCNWGWRMAKACEKYKKFNNPAVAHQT